VTTSVQTTDAAGAVGWISGPVIIGAEGAFWGFLAARGGSKEALAASVSGHFVVVGVEESFVCGHSVVVVEEAAGEEEVGGGMETGDKIAQEVIAAPMATIRATMINRQATAITRGPQANSKRHRQIRKCL